MKNLRLIPLFGVVLLTIVGCATSHPETRHNNTQGKNVTKNRSHANVVTNSSETTTSNTTSNATDLRTPGVNNSGTTPTSLASNGSKTVRDVGVPFSKLGDVSSVKMVEPDNGWAASNKGVYRTSDGGHRWILELRGNAAFTTNGQVFFVNKDTAYAILPVNNTTSSLCVTHDGGQHWQHSILDIAAQTVLQMSFANSKTGWTMTAPGGAAGPMEPVAIYKTIDGGLHTQLIVPAPTQSRKSHGIPQNTLKLGIYFQSPTQGWLTGDSWENDIWLYETNDGGLTWSNHSITSVPTRLKHDLGGDQLPGDPVFFTASRGALPVKFTPGGGFCLYVTTDGGKHWRYTTPLLLEKDVQYDILDAKHVFVATGRKLYETKNLGRSWSIGGQWDSY